MSHANPVLAVFIVSLASLSSAFGWEEQPVYSGPQIGEKLTPFHVRGVLGDLAGKEFDLVDDAEGKPIVLVFVHELTRPSAALMRAVMNYASSHAKEGLISGVVFLSDDATAAEEMIKRASHALPKVPIGISIDGAEGPGAYGLNRNVSLTILIGKENKVTANFALVQPSVQADAPKIGRQIALVVGKDETPTLAQMGVEQYGDQRPAMRQDPNLAPLLRALIQKTASKEDVDKAAEAIESYVADKPLARQQVGDVARRIIAAEKLQDYGTPAAQEYLRKWAVTFRSARREPVANSEWEKHVVYSGEHCNTAVGGDFTGDGLPDVICNTGGMTRLLVAPDWREVVIDGESKLSLIHSDVMDVDGDGDLDFIGAQYQPGHILWLEQPDKPLAERWPYHLIDDQVIGIHGLLVGDVDRKGKPDLLANSAQPIGPFANSLVWYRVPDEPREAKSWPRFVFAKGDAPGLSHYLGVGDVNGDGLPDSASAAKGGPTDTTGMGDWFAWWQAPSDPTKVWIKHLISDKQPGATNIHPADVNGDGKTDFIASRGHGRGVIWFEAPKWKERTIHESLEGPHCLVVTDLDGDGDVDAATCAKDDQLAVWFENDGRGRFKTHVVGRDQAAYDIRAVDMDRDGDLDLLVAGQTSKNVVWYENPVK